jgi:hypothetical protein
MKKNTVQLKKKSNKELEYFVYFVNVDFDIIFVNRL